jgi:hypothetical protein
MHTASPAALIFSIRPDRSLTLSVQCSSRRCSLPNAVYRTAEGAAFDVEGIPLDIQAPVFADDDVAAGSDPGMAMAVQVLTGKRKR